MWNLFSSPLCLLSLSVHIYFCLFHHFSIFTYIFLVNSRYVLVGTTKTESIECLNAFLLHFKINLYMWWMNCYQLMTQPIHELCAKKALTFMFIQSINRLLCVHPDDILHHSQFYKNHNSQAGWRHLKKKKATSRFIKKVKNTTGQNKTFRLFPLTSTCQQKRSMRVMSDDGLLLPAPDVIDTSLRWDRCFAQPAQSAEKSFLESADPSQSASWMAPWQTAWCRGEIFQLLF